MPTIRSLLFPQHYRQVPHRRLILNILRAAHLLSISILVGGIFFHIEPNLLTPWLIATVTTGLGLFMLDLYESFDTLFEIRGVSVLIKILLLLCIPVVNENNQTLLLIVVIIFSSFVSHSTRRLRHKNYLPVTLQQKWGLRSNNQFKTKPK
ncbi:MAG: hypothetical protein HOM14_20485 [Gammaproteobacteria bacterium]|jgi:hypothetical protein|nr:hypothetical protein [Gammaproteobacteria bacterium]MBT3724880.1 hypothetical protein [Gammaproteobacteria bacterium]MBT4076296.1 hypothetical protein [Gammaproteobacteria bacterium]MBT4192954.1 hypothetical protein [Gammaproteobacteria bacterium]MBT4450893.1 hypothetical protein [Gammaproteobacteria bacterium]